MPTTKKRLNVTLSDDLIAALEALAKHDRVPVATKAKELLEEIVEMYEDQVWEALASERDTKRAKYLSSEETWA